MSHGTRYTPSGVVISDAYPRLRGAPGVSARGLNLRGVVVANDDDTDDAAEAYCSVLVYSGLPGMRTALLRHVLVTYERRGLHNGEITRPRGTTIDVAAGPDGVVNVNTATDPANMDGDHVIVAFLDDDLQLPFILRFLPHPHSDRRDSPIPPAIDTPGHRLTLREADGLPSLVRHQGAFWGADADGNFLVDVSRSYDREHVLSTDGAEPAPPATDSSGNVTVRLRAGRALTIDIVSSPDTPAATPAIRLQVLDDRLELSRGGAVLLRAEGAGPDATLTIGTGAQHAALAEPLQALWTLLRAAGASLTPPLAVPDWDPAISSSHLTVPSE